jgi:hypothetical protein
LLFARLVLARAPSSCWGVEVSGVERLRGGNDRHCGLRSFFFLLLLSDIAAPRSDYHDPFSSPKKGSRGKFRLHYEYVFWTIFSLLTAYTILDRFYVNLFPMSINFKPLVRGAHAHCLVLY